MSARFKIRQIPHVNFELTSQFFFKFCIICIIYNSPVNFKLIHFLLWIKLSQQSPKFEIFECSSQNLLNFSCHFKKNKSVFFQIMYQTSVPSSITPTYFLAEALYTLVKNTPLQFTFLRFSSPWVNVRQLPYVNFELKVNSFSNFSSFFSAITHNSVNF